MLSSLIVYSLSAFFLFYLTNHSELPPVLRGRSWLDQFWWPDWLLYSVQCSFCMTFWLTLFLLLFTAPLPLVFLLAAPPVVLLLDLAYQRLRPIPQPPF